MAGLICSNNDIAIASLFPFLTVNSKRAEDAIFEISSFLQNPGSNNASFPVYGASQLSVLCSGITNQINFNNWLSTA